MSPNCLPTLILMATPVRVKEIGEDDEIQSPDEEINSPPAEGWQADPDGVVPSIVGGGDIVAEPQAKYYGQRGQCRYSQRANSVHG